MKVEGGMARCSFLLNTEVTFRHISYGHPLPTLCSGQLCPYMVPVLGFLTRLSGLNPGSTACYLEGNGQIVTTLNIVFLIYKMGVLIIEHTLQSIF